MEKTHFPIIFADFYSILYVQKGDGAPKLTRSDMSNKASGQCLPHTISNGPARGKECKSSNASIWADLVASIIASLHARFLRKSWSQSA